MALGAVILAAGDARRLGVPKALLTRDGETALARVVRIARAVGCDPLVVVVGRHGAEIRASGSAEGATLVPNPAPEHGRTGSLKVGLGAARMDEALVWPVDRPCAAEATVRALAAATGDVRLPVHENHRGHPILLAGAALREVLALADDAPLHDVVHRDAARVREVRMNDPGILVDLDTPEDAARAGWSLPVGRRAKGS